MATTTPNFGWPVPTSTDLVKDGAVAIEGLGDAIDASLLDLKGGTTGQVLSKATNADMDFTWVAQDDSNAIQNALLTTTGDTIYASAASTPARRAIGTTGQVLTVSGGVPVWATPSGGGFPASTVFTPTVTSQSGSITTYTATGSYQTSGKLVVANFKITLTNVGTASGTLYATLPVQAVTLANGTWNGTCVENNTTGKTGIMSVTSGSTIVTSRDYNFGSWFTNGYVIYGSVTYEVA